jgi:hypothetical protein
MIIMKKWVIYACILLVVACGNRDRKVNIENKPEAPLSIANKDELFNLSFGKLLNDYYQLKDNFITEDDSLINYYANNLMKDADSLQIKELKADSAIVLTAKSGAESMSGELKGLLGEKNIEEKRRSFYTLSEELYDLIRTVQYDKQVVYHFHCPMAFNNEGATWLSNSTEIKNPYLPKKMPACGEVTDSLSFGIKK